jgi:protein gp37
MNKTSIEWTDYTWNPVTGCSKVSQGCKNCYAELMFKRFGKTWNQEFNEVTIHPERLNEPSENAKKWKGKKVFVCSMSDLFHENVPTDFIIKVWSIFADHPQTTFQILQIPAHVRFLSCEPLLGDLDLSNYLPIMEPANNNVDWVIVGGESGRNARPMHPTWVRSIRDQCEDSSVPFFFKQWGQYLPLEFDVQAPFRIFSNSNQIIDGHTIDVINTNDPLGKPGSYNGHAFMDAFEAILLCEKHKVEQVDFWSCGKSIAGNHLDAKQYLQFPIK